ncbi:hypothetical protein BN903_65 [Halorubrum sp. AJ67]|nr:hypothetical protein BN903_65 [Halorubrum sp. AJ67]
MNIVSTLQTTELVLTGVVWTIIQLPVSTMPLLFNNSVAIYC